MRNTMKSANSVGGEKKEKKIRKVTKQRAAIICRYAQNRDPRAIQLIHQIAQPIAKKVATSLAYAYSQSLGTVDIPELISIALVQVLTSAARNFDPAKCNSFKSYLEAHIKGKLRKMLNSDYARLKTMECYDESESEDGDLEFSLHGSSFSGSGNGNGNGKHSSLWSKISKSKLIDPGYALSEVWLDLLLALMNDPLALELLSLQLNGYKEKEICERMQVSKGKLWRKQREIRRFAKNIFPQAGK